MRSLVVANHSTESLVESPVESLVVQHPSSSTSNISSLQRPPPTSLLLQHFQNPQHLRPLHTPTTTSTPQQQQQQQTTSTPPRLILHLHLPAIRPPFHNSFTPHLHHELPALRLVSTRSPIRPSFRITHSPEKSAKVKLFEPPSCLSRTRPSPPPLPPTASPPHRSPASTARLVPTIPLSSQCRQSPIRTPGKGLWAMQATPSRPTALSPIVPRVRF